MTDLRRNITLAAELIAEACDELERRPEFAPVTIQSLRNIAAALDDRRRAR